MFERYSETARSAIQLAKREARRSEAKLISPVHVFLGIIALDDVVVASVFDPAPPALADARERASGWGVAEARASADPMFDHAAWETIKSAVAVAQSVGNTFVGPEHVLLALITGDSTGKQLQSLMNDLSIDTKAVRTAIESTLVKGDRPKQDGHPAPELVGVPRKGGSEPGRRGVVSPTGGALEEFTTDLIELARAGELGPVVGREGEIDRVIRILARRQKSNPVLVGHAGVGKTAVVEGLAMRMAEGNVPAHLADRQLHILDVAGLVAGARYRGDFEDRLKQVLDQAIAANVLLFIDEIHAIAGAGAGEGSMDAASILKPFLARGRVSVIGATTPDEYRQYIERDVALERRFQQVWVDEPSSADSVEMLKGMRSALEEHHDVVITDEALEAATDLSTRLDTQRQLPDKAVDLLDEAAAKVQVDFSSARVTRGDVADVLEESTGIPAGDLSEKDLEGLQRLEARLGDRVVGIPDAISALARAVRRNRVGLADRGRPIGSFIFAGPTGVGKTELAKALAEVLFGTSESLVTIDLGEYTEQHSSARLLGAPPGYVGFGEGGQLTELIRRKPYSVLLLDEAEKAHPDVFNILLSILEEGRLTDGSGRAVDFTNTVIIFTTNLGIEDSGRTLGFQASEADESANMKAAISTELARFFRPEFLNRIDETIVFPRIRQEVLLQIVDGMLEKLNSRVPDYTFSFSVAAREWLADKGYDPELGARPLRRVIQRDIEDRIADLMMSGEVAANAHIDVDVTPDGAELSFRTRSTDATAAGPQRLTEDRRVQPG